MQIRTALEALGRRPLRFLGSAWPWRSLAFLLTGSVVGIVPVGVIAILAQAELGPATIFVALAFLLRVGVGGRYVARFERFRLRLVDNESIGGRDFWRETWYGAIVIIVLWWIDLSVAGTAITVPAVAILSPVVQPDAAASTAGMVLAVLASVAGVVGLLVGVYVMTAWAGARAVLARAILAPREEELRTELAEVSRSRARLVDAFEVERRRIERDLHDGAQQRLVGLSMKLGLARLDAADCAPLIADQLDDAHAEVQEALAELRELIRGVHPQVLTDRGPAAAVEDIADRSPVPVSVDMEIPRVSPGAEATAYFVIVEALANAAKHGTPSSAEVWGRVIDGSLIVEVRDDGAGGADPARGSGLTGLADRASAAGGRLLLSSPHGGPTVVRMEIPCE